MRSCRSSGVREYVLGRSDPLMVDVEVANDGEDAFETMFFLNLPPGVNYVKLQPHPGQQVRSVVGPRRRVWWETKTGRCVHQYHIYFTDQSFEATKYQRFRQFQDGFVEQGTPCMQTHQCRVTEIPFNNTTNCGIKTNVCRGPF